MSSNQGIGNYSLEDIKENLNFSLQVFDLESGAGEQLKAHVAKIADYFDKRILRGPLFSLTQELAANALKAIYKNIFYDTFIQELGLEGMEYTDWLKLFKTEIDSHHTENFERVAREKNLFVDIAYVVDDTFLSIKISNPGSPSEIEIARIRESMANARELKDMSYLFLDDDEDESEKEGAGIGLPLLIMTLRGLGIKPDNFTIDAQDNCTYACIKIPLTVLVPGGWSNGKPLIASFQPVKDCVKHIAPLFQRLGYSVIVFSILEEVISVSGDLQEKFNLKAPAGLKDILPERFFKEIFQGKEAIRINEQFENYRIGLEINQVKQFYNVSGILNNDSTVITLWQPIELVSSMTINEGHFETSFKKSAIIRNYVSEKIITLAEQNLAKGNNYIKDQFNSTSILMIKLNSFLQAQDADKAKENTLFLNTIISFIVRACEINSGMIERLHGELSISIFDDEYKAIKCGVEIQRLFNDLNALRQIAGSSAIDVSVVCCHGKINFANLGNQNQRNLEFSAFGEVIEEAYRISRIAPLSKLLINQSLFDKVVKQIKISEKSRVIGQNKDEIIVYSVSEYLDQKGNMVIASYNQDGF